MVLGNIQKSVVEPVVHRFLKKLQYVLIFE